MDTVSLLGSGAVLSSGCVRRTGLAAIGQVRLLPTKPDIGLRCGGTRDEGRGLYIPFAPHQNQREADAAASASLWFPGVGKRLRQTAPPLSLASREQKV